MRDLRKYARNTTFQLVIGAILLLFLVGLPLIGLIYGTNAAVLGLICMGAGLAPIALIILVLWILEWISNRAKGD
jgi:hypothetical protein